ncbi:hypothetical protein ACP70R_017736 [Stipagrostis hirtigluma subsp. patula]
MPALCNRAYSSPRAFDEPSSSPSTSSAGSQARLELGSSFFELELEVAKLAQARLVYSPSFRPAAAACIHPSCLAAELHHKDATAESLAAAAARLRWLHPRNLQMFARR